MREIAVTVPYRKPPVKGSPVVASIQHSEGGFPFSKGTTKGLDAFVAHVIAFDVQLLKGSVLLQGICQHCCP